MQVHRLSIRPLESTEVQARRLTGRHQITSDGRHLVDGIPFGRRLTERSIKHRPEVQIPPRKKRRLGLLGWEADDEPSPELDDDYLEELLDPDWQEKEDDSEDYEDEDEDEEDLENEQKEEKEEKEEERKEERGDAEKGEDQYGNIDERNKKSLESLQTPPLQDNTRQLAEGAETLRPESIDESTNRSAANAPSRRSSVSSSTSSSTESSESSSSTPSSTSTSTSSSASSSSSSSASSSELDATEIVTDEDSTSGSPQETPSSDEFSKSEDEKPQPSAPPKRDTEDTTKRATLEDTSHLSQTTSSGNQRIVPREMTHHVPPGRGSKLTKRGNAREKRRRKLQRLKSARVLSENANFQDLAIWEEQNPGDLDEILPRDSTEPVTASNSTGGEAGESCADERRSDDISALTDSLSLDTRGAGSTDKQTEDGSYIIIPRKKSSDLTYADITPSEPTDWQNAHNGEQKTLLVGATECLYEDVELDSPPFPFVQRWDKEAIAIIRNRSKTSQTKKQNSRSTSRKTHRQAEVDATTEHDTETSGQALTDNVPLEQYDGASFPNGTEDSTVEGGIPENTQDTDSSLPDARVGLNGDTGDLPSLPNNISELKPATRDEMTKSTIVVFKQLELTNQWQPAISPWRTAIIMDVLPDGRLSCRLAKRDRKAPSEPEKDEEGNRLYSKFDMPGYSEQSDEDDGIREVAFSGMIEPKILQARVPAVSTANNSDEQQQPATKSATPDLSGGGPKRKISQLEAKMVRPKPRRNAHKNRS